jgi:hypothetical protein
MGLPRRPTDGEEDNGGELVVGDADERLPKRNFGSVSSRGRRGSSWYSWLRWRSMGTSGRQWAPWGRQWWRTVAPGVTNQWLGLQPVATRIGVDGSPSGRLNGGRGGWWWRSMASWAVGGSGEQSMRKEEGKWEMSPLYWATRERVRPTPHGRWPPVVYGHHRVTTCGVSCTCASNWCGRLSGVSDWQVGPGSVLNF